MSIVYTFQVYEDSYNWMRALKMKTLKRCILHSKSVLKLLPGSIWFLLTTSRKPRKLIHIKQDKIGPNILTERIEIPTRDLNQSLT
jgi:hypothetical protein